LVFARILARLEPFERVLRWPLPALLAWAGAWVLFNALLRTQASAAMAFGLAASSAAACGWLSVRPWRRLIVALGFPISLLLAGGIPAVPAWAWLLPLAVLALAYPAHAWRDAPVFPTPAGALNSLAHIAPLPPQARVLDAGCGLGHGLIALRAAYPQAQLVGIEWSWPLRLWTGLRCRWALVQQGDMWRGSWEGFDMVYLFQRPESMARAMTKAQAEMRPGSWLVSLAFAVPDQPAHAVHHTPGGREVWIYRIGAAP
jgi:hypothetical protein